MDRYRWLRILAATVLLLGFSVGRPSPTEAYTCPCNLLGSAVPAVVDTGPDADFNLGLRFKASTDGYVTGMRFYKAAVNTGTHVGTLWSYAPGSDDYFKLSQATFTAETTSGWQTVTFPKPIKIFANQAYKVSYTAFNAHYSYDANYFGVPRTNGPIEGIGGVFGYAANANQIPKEDSTASYGVDVTFATSIGSHSLLGMPTSVPGPLDQASRELGVKFSSDVPTAVLGIRYYAEIPFYTERPVSLWTSTGTLLAQDVYPSRLVGQEGWYEVYFDTPVDIDANTTYVASYQATYYVQTPGYFSSAFTSGNWHAPVNAGVYKDNAYGFPTDVAADGSNFWVDPILSTDRRAKVQITASIPPALTFAVSGLSGSCNGVTQSSGVSTSGSGIDLGALTNTANAIAAQQLEVVTNAGGGYTVYAQSSGTPPEMKTFSGLAGASNSNPTSFTAPGTEAFGYTTDDSGLSAIGSGSSRFTAPATRWSPLSTSPAEVSRSLVTGAKTVCIAYQAGISSTSAAGRYGVNVRYSVVPSF